MFSYRSIPQDDVTLCDLPGLPTRYQPMFWGRKLAVGDMDMDAIDYFRTNADHQIFGAAASGELALSRSLPLFIHGDEGRHFNPCWLNSVPRLSARHTCSNVSKSRLEASQRRSSPKAFCC